LNPRPSDYKSDALPTELRQHGANRGNITKGNFNCKIALWKICANLTQAARGPFPGPHPPHTPQVRAGRIHPTSNALPNQSDGSPSLHRLELTRILLKLAQLQLSLSGSSIGCVIFEWHPAKAAKNLSKHHVSFQEASTVFGDRLALTYVDPDHSIDEERFLTIGVSGTGRVLVVAHADRRDRIRIISARVATPSERRQYEQEEN
jgi:uncharacterized protein